MNTDELESRWATPPTVSQVRKAETWRHLSRLCYRSLPVVRQLVFAGGLGLLFAGVVSAFSTQSTTLEFAGWGAVMVGLCAPLRRGTWNSR